MISSIKNINRAIAHKQTTTPSYREQANCTTYFRQSAYYSILGIEMGAKRDIKIIARHLAIGVVLPILLLFNAFLVPEPYSHPLVNVATSPTKLMPFLENRELMRELTRFVFGKMTANYAPITTVFLIIFWFLVGVLLSIASKYIAEHRSNA